MNRWWVLTVFILSSTINYLDRQTLATLAPLLREEFHLSNAEYGLIVTAFSITYAAGAPFAGFLIDRIGLNRGISLAVGLWSLTGVATGLVRGLGGLVCCRAVLGLAEAAGIPAAGKAIHRYMLPQERALGNSMNQAGVSLGLILAPPIATWLALRYGWQMAFIATGCLGFLWIPIWKLVGQGSTLPPTRAGRGGRPGSAPLKLLRNRRLWGFVIANAFSMSTYSLWTNWTTLYLVSVSRLTLAEAAWYAWIPPVFAALGGFAGGWLSLQRMNQGMEAIAARKRVCLVSALASLATAIIPLFPGAMGASAGISFSIFSVAAFSVNMYTMPLDAFGGESAAFAISLLVSGYGLMQAFISPAFGAVIDRFGYAPVCIIASIMPLAAYAVLQWTEEDP